MTSFTSLESALKYYFGYSSFRVGQKEIIESALNNRDLLVIMPTGGGKSLCFQLPALLKNGLTIVVSPLIALMQDQVDALKDNGIGATFLNSSLNWEEEKRRQDAILKNQIKLLYVAPERLLNERFSNFINLIKQRIGISGIAIDEAHCVSEWGHDFRPEYRKINQFRFRYPDIPITALTATATKRVQEDILQQLKLRNPFIHRASFNRPNLNYEVRNKGKNSYYYLLKAIRAESGSGIVYCTSRKKVEETALKLKADGIEALPYHGQMDSAVRSRTQTSFLRDDIRVIVATIAFGMGIDKPDVRFVFHYDLPRSLESFYQESGRAGRDGEGSKSLIFFSLGDIGKIKYFIDQKPDENEKRIAKQQLERVVDYAQGTDCRRKIILRYFGERFSGNCGNCDNCLNPKPIEDWTIEAQKFLCCVIRCNQKFGMNHIIDVLMGSRNQKVMKNGHHLLSTHGIGKDKTREEWKHLVRSLLHQGLLSETTDGYGVLKINKASEEIIWENHPVKIPVDKKQKSNIDTSSNPRKIEDEILLDKLKVLRKKIADSQAIAPYVICSDSTLKLMSQLKPKDKDEFAKISGINPHKVEQYSDRFISEIREFISFQKLPVRLPNKSSMLTLQLHQQGLSVSEIAKKRGFVESTIYTHLSELLAMKQPVVLNNFVTEDKKQVILNAIYKKGAESLKELKEFLGDDYSYNEIKLVRGWWRGTIDN